MRLRSRSVPRLTGRDGNWSAAGRAPTSDYTGRFDRDHRRADGDGVFICSGAGSGAGLHCAGPGAAVVAGRQRIAERLGYTNFQTFNATGLDLGSRSPKTSGPRPCRISRVAIGAAFAAPSLPTRD